MEFKTFSRNWNLTNASQMEDIHMPLNCAFRWRTIDLIYLITLRSQVELRLKMLETCLRSDFECSFVRSFTVWFVGKCD